MKVIKERREIAEAINFGKHPVVFVEDLSACRTDYGWNLGKVKIASGKGWFHHADLYIFKDAKKIVTASDGCCLTSSFGWHDVAKMAENANAPELKADSKFVLVLGKKGVGGCVLMVNTGKAQLNTSEPIDINEDMSEILRMFKENM